MAEPDENPLAAVVQSLPAIPTTAKRGLVRGLSYLLGGLANYLGAWLHRPVQAIEDRTDARTVITQAIALAAAQKLSQNPAVISAAIAQWGPADLNRQLNKMHIARETIIELSTPDQGTNQGDDDVPQGEISDDFLNSFERFCADSSDENMQKLWARLLAGEIKRPGSFSRQTMRCLYELDKDVAALFDKLARRTVGQVLMCNDEKDVSILEINQLQAAGLITGGGGLYNYTFKFNEKGISIMKTGENLLICKKVDGARDFTLTSYPLTDAGSELISLLKDYDERSALIELAEMLPSDVVSDITIQPFTVINDGMGLGKPEVLRGKSLVEPQEFR